MRGERREERREGENERVRGVSGEGRSASRRGASGRGTKDENAAAVP